MKQDDIIPDEFIVTVSSSEGKFELDMAVPAEFLVRDVRGKLLETLKSLGNGKFSAWRDCRLRYGNRFLSDTETFAMVGAFEGSRIIVIEE